MIVNPTSPEQRQHLNLSQFAYDVICNDSINFIGKLNISGFINTVVENSMVDSFDDYCLMEEERILSELSNTNIRLTETERNTLKKIAAAHRNNLLQSLDAYHKDNVLKIRLNKNLYSKLYPERSEWSGRKYGLTQGSYIKLLIEEYAKMTYYNRESVFFKNDLEVLNNSITIQDSQKRILTITMKDGRKYNCKLYRLSEEYETHYHYLIGLFATEDTTEYKIASIRLSRIASISVRGRSLGSGKLTNSEVKLINNKIKENSIPYLVGEPTQFVVKLTPLGMIMYDYNYSRRPIYEGPLKQNEDGTYTMRITATERQIKNYFFAFGKEAIIQSPDEMKLWMLDKYSSAAESYTP